MNTRQELLACLPNIAPESRRVGQVATDVWMGLRSSWNGPRLARVENVGGNRYVHVPPNTVNLCSENISRQRLITFSQRDSHIMSQLNTQLRGGRSYPVVSGVAGMFANVGYSIITTAVSARQAAMTMEVQARTQDEVWAIEMVGKQGQELKHVLYLWLVDPVRGGQAGQTGCSAWLIHERRNNLVAP